MGECFGEEKKHLAGAVEVYGGGSKNTDQSPGPSGNMTVFSKTSSNTSYMNQSSAYANVERRMLNAGNDGAKVGVERTERRMSNAGNDGAKAGLRSPNQNCGLFVGGGKAGGFHRRASSGPCIISSGFDQNFDAVEHTLQGGATKVSPNRGMNSTGEYIPTGGSPVSELAKEAKSNSARGIGNVLGANATKMSSTRMSSAENPCSGAALKVGCTPTPRKSSELSMPGNNNQSMSSPKNSGEFCVGGNGNVIGSAGSSPATSGELGSGLNTNAKLNLSSCSKTHDVLNGHGNGSLRVAGGGRAPAEGNISGRVNTCLNNKGTRSIAVSPTKPRQISSIVGNMGNLCKGNWNATTANGGNNVPKGKAANFFAHGPLPGNGNILGQSPAFVTGNVLKSGVRSSGLFNKGANKVDADAVEMRDGDVIENGLLTHGLHSWDPEEVKNAGNDLYKKGRFSEALSLYERAIFMAPGNAAYRSNKAAALTGLGRLAEAVHECEEAIKLDPFYVRAHQRAASLYLRLGLVESSIRHFQAAGQQDDLGQQQQVKSVKDHISKCIESRKALNWKSVLWESDAAIMAGADCSPQVFGYKAEALLMFNKPEEADAVLSTAEKVESLLMKLGVIPADSFILVVRVLIDMALGRFEEAVSTAEHAARIDPRKVEVFSLLRKTRAVCRARNLGNDYFKAGKFFEACAAYGEGLESDPGNSTLLCNRAACRSKLSQWEKAIEDCNAALDVHPSYTKALMRRANCNAKLERWESALNDYEALAKKLPGDVDVARGLFDAQMALKRSQGNSSPKVNFGGVIQEVSNSELFHEAVTFRGLVVVEFITKWNEQCKQISAFVDALCKRYESVKFIKVDVEENPYLARAESVSFIPTFQIYRNGMKVDEIREPNQRAIEQAVQQYSL